jgi:hypothetical protein
MPLIPIFKGYLLNKGSTMKPKGEDIVKLGSQNAITCIEKIKHFIIFKQFWNFENVIMNIMHDNL